MTTTSEQLLKARFCMMPLTPVYIAMKKVAKDIENATLRSIIMEEKRYVKQKIMHKDRSRKLQNIQKEASYDCVIVRSQLTKNISVGASKRSASFVCVSSRLNLASLLAGLYRIDLW